jgi:hypothetical protein
VPSERTILPVGINLRKFGFGVYLVYIKICRTISVNKAFTKCKIHDANNKKIIIYIFLTIQGIHNFILYFKSFQMLPQNLSFTFQIYGNVAKMH